MLIADMDLDDVPDSQIILSLLPEKIILDYKKNREEIADPQRFFG